MHNHIKSRPLPVVFFTLFVNALGFSILIPIIPLLLADPQSPFYLLTNGLTLQTGYIILGFLTGIFAIMQFFATPILGQLSDKYGRKPLLLFSLFGTFVAYVVFAIAIYLRNIPLLFISRAFDGITGGNISVAQAAIADITTPEKRARNFGLIGAAFGLGFILGPYLGGKLSDPTLVSWFNATTPFWVAALLSLLNVLFVEFFFEETHQHMRTDLVINWSKSLLNIMHAYTFKNMRVVFLSVFLFYSAFTFFTTFFSVYLIHRFQFSQGNIGDFFAYVGLWSVFAQAVIIRRVHGKFGEASILRVTLFASGFSVLLYLFPTIWWQMIFIVPFFSIFSGLSTVGLTSLISRSTDPSQQGEILGISASIQALAQGIPPILAGFIAASLSPESPIIIAIVTFIAAGIVFMFYHPRKPTIA